MPSPKQILFATLAIVGVTTIAYADQDKSDDRKSHAGKISQSYDLKDFDRIDVSGVYELDVRVGEKFSLELTATPDDLARAEIDVAGETLNLAMKKNKRNWNKKKKETGIYARVTMPSLNGVEVSGVVDGAIAGVDAKEFDIYISGVGDLEFSGKCENLNAKISGVGDLEADELACNDVYVRVSGVGDASVFAKSSVDASVSGMGDIDVFGSPSKVTQNGGLFSDISIR